MQKTSSIYTEHATLCLSTAQRIKSNKKTKKNKMTLKESNELMEKVDKN
jgi:hypothetical protein